MCYINKEQHTRKHHKQQITATTNLVKKVIHHSLKESLQVRIQNPKATQLVNPPSKGIERGNKPQWFMDLLLTYLLTIVSR
jgi:hypothetical protein